MVDRAWRLGYLIVEVVNLQLVASSAVGEVEAAVLLGAEQLRVSVLPHAGGGQKTQTQTENHML